MSMIRKVLVYRWRRRFSNIFISFQRIYDRPAPNSIFFFGAAFVHSRFVSVHCSEQNIAIFSKRQTFINNIALQQRYKVCLKISGLPTTSCLFKEFMIDLRLILFFSFVLLPSLPVILLFTTASKTSTSFLNVKHLSTTLHYNNITRFVLSFQDFLHFHVFSKNL